MTRVKCHVVSLTLSYQMAARLRSFLQASAKSAGNEGGRIAEYQEVGVVLPMNNVIDRKREWVIPTSIATLQSGDAAARFPAEIAGIAAQHRPSRMPFFKTLAGLPREAARNPVLLGGIHLVYQAAMHATRAAVYYLPHLDSPALRKRKLQIFVDDDGLPDGDTHHYQLSRVFRNIGASLILGDEEFGDPELLCQHLDPQTADFVRLAQNLYSRSLGAWCIVEVMSDDWMRALAEALAKHFPQ